MSFPIDPQNTHSFDVMTYGAKGDGVTDDTAAIQAALDAAGPVQGTVTVPNGVFLCSRLRMPPYVGIVGFASWGYRRGGGSVLKLNNENATCLIDITLAIGATIYGLTLDGSELGKNIHGIYYGPVEKKDEEDAPRVERCHISRFSGDGIHFDPIWCFSVRNCEIIFNGGNAIYVHGYDGFILDNWLSGNKEAGFRAENVNASITMTGNRIEWNREGGISIVGGSHYNITGNYIDRSGGPAISLMPLDDRPCRVVTITGNVIYRSGKPEWTPDDYSSCHVRIEKASGITFTGNSLCVGADDWGQGTTSPSYGIVVRALKNCIITNNTLHIGARRELIVDLGEHDEGVIIKDNVGTVFTDTGGIWESPQW